MRANSAVLRVAKPALTRLRTAEKFREASAALMRAMAKERI
jgi:hypothetical protein